MEQRRRTISRTRGSDSMTREIFETEADVLLFPSHKSIRFGKGKGQEKKNIFLTEQQLQFANEKFTALDEGSRCYLDKKQLVEASSFFFRFGGGGGEVQLGLIWYILVVFKWL
eukprot:TRINITY_DN16144_c0_g2_i3.p1 TRINITY_DN16144_c0_g2~~TRINITY_DN16144_c0_g2_i3.p1  ORF type:complete len:113 (+),score=15.40 TRINITY_DN16144_c0_g2_i3:90-428(+)